MKYVIQVIRAEKTYYVRGPVNANLTDDIRRANRFPPNESMATIKYYWQSRHLVTNVFYIVAPESRKEMAQ